MQVRALTLSVHVYGMLVLSMRGYVYRYACTVTSVCARLCLQALASSSTKLKVSACQCVFFACAV